MPYIGGAAAAQRACDDPGRRPASGGKLHEFNDVETEGCALGPAEVDVAQAAAGRKIVVFGLPGAYTPTCSAKHVPGYLQHHQALRDAGVDEIWCVSVNDAFVMGAWGREQQCAGKVRMLGDGSAVFTDALGLTQDLSARGMGVRSKRYAMFVEDGVVRSIDVEEPGKFEVSDAESVLKVVRG